MCQTSNNMQSGKENKNHLKQLKPFIFSNSCVVFDVVQALRETSSAVSSE